MKRGALGWVVGVGFLVATTGVATGADKVDLGKGEYDVHCAVCHGIAGKGDGPYKYSMTKAPTDLTELARRNGGAYPFNRVYEVIDGRRDVAAHGTREMPIWGNRYAVGAAEHYVDVAYDPNVYVRGRILALTEYVYRLQAR